MDGVTALERSYGQLSGLVANLEPGELEADCGGWDVRAMLNHAVGAAWMFTLVNQGQAVGEDAGDVVGDDPAAAVAEIAPANIASWQGPAALDGDRVYPFGTFPAPAALLINIGEIAVHAWDLADATGQDATIAFGPEISVPASAPADARLLGYLGRQP